MKKAVPILTVIIFITSLFFIPTKKEIKLRGQFSSKDLKNSFPSEYEWMKRSFPHFKVDPSAHLEALKQTKELRESSRLNKSKSLEWEFLGPVNIGGRIADIEFNPVNPNIVYAGAAAGGVFKSTNTGETWFPVFDDASTLMIGDIAVDPVNPDVIYVGTGEPNGSHNNFPGTGVYKSTDAGNTWTNIGLELTSNIGRVLVDPNDNNIVYVAAVGSNFAPHSERGLFKSTNAGESWENILFVDDTTGCIDVILDPNDSNFLMAAMWHRYRKPGYGQSETSYGASGGIFKTTDGGNNWEKLGAANGLPVSPERIGKIGLTISPSNNNVIYALYNDGGVISGLYKSTDKGINWQFFSPENGLLDGASNFSWYFGQVRVHPTNPNTVFVLDVAFMKSTNSGGSWPINYGYGGPWQLHVDHHALAFHPQNPEYIISGNDGGINISTNGGSTWSEPKHLPITQYYEIGLDKLNPNRLYGGSQDNSTHRTLTGSWDDWDIILGGDGFYVNVDYTNSNIIYAEYQYGSLFKSVDGGNNFDYVTPNLNWNEPTNWSTPVILDPNNPSIVYYGSNRLWRSTNGGNSWTPISEVLTRNNPDWPRFGTLTTIAVGPSNSNVIYVGTDDGKIWVSSDNGTTWKDITNTSVERWVTRVVPDNNDENIIYATYSGLKWRDPDSRVFKSTNMGEDWIDISYNLPDAPVNSFAIDPSSPNTLYAGLDVGVFVLKGNGTWEAYGTGLPIVTVYDMKVHPTTKKLIIGTHGRSMYGIDTDGAVTVNDESNIPANFVLEQNYPNPFNPTTTISFSIAARSVISTSPSGDGRNLKDFSSTSSPRNDNMEVSLKVYDILGNEAATLVNETKSPGSYEVSWNASEFASGIYIYRLTSGSINLSKKMILIK